MNKVLQFSVFLILCTISSKGNAQINHWETAVSESDTWNYLVPNTNVNVAWNTIGFNTVGWNSGIGGFGFGDGDDNTILPNGTISCYQRIEFTITDTSAIDVAALSIDYDDAFVAYFNGVEISRDFPNRLGRDRK